MNELDSFTTMLKEVVGAKRLSASKMSNLTNIAMQLMENDTQLVSILYRTHKSLPSAAKVSSLYVFDALSRAARSQVTKHGLTGDVTSIKGNAATFLLKVEGVLEGLFQDMVTSTNAPDQQEKTKKILDIWVKGNTFPSGVLVRLKEIVTEVEKKESEIGATRSGPAPSAQIFPVAPPSGLGPTLQPAIPTIDPVQSTLLALLSQAAATAAPTIQTIPNTGIAQLDKTQLALLQQLAQSAQAANGLPSQTAASFPLSSLVRTVVPAQPLSITTSNSVVQGHLPSRNNHQESPSHEEAGHSRYDSEDRGRTRDDRYNDPSPRGGWRGNRGRGRGGRRDDRDRFRERDRSPPPRARHSRSRSPRSPRRYGGRRDIKPYSPPRRPSMAPHPGSEESRTTESVTSTSEVEKDEFGRDLRPRSPESMPAPGSSKTQPPEHSEKSPTNQAPAQNLERLGISDTQSTNSQTSNVPSEPGLDKFSIETFDFTSPASWEALGKMWHVSCGYPPSQEELMQFITGGAVMPESVVNQSVNDQSWGNSGWPNAHRGAVGQRDRRGRGSSGYGRGGRGRSAYFGEQEAYMNSEYTSGPSDAVVLGGGSEETPLPNAEDDQGHLPAQGRLDTETGTGKANVGSHGRMQRVGDKWMYVRDSPGVVS